MNGDQEVRSSDSIPEFPLLGVSHDLWKPDPREYREYLDVFDLTEEEEVQLLEALACLIQHFIEADEVSS